MRRTPERNLLAAIALLVLVAATSGCRPSVRELEIERNACRNIDQLKVSGVSSLSAPAAERFSQIFGSRAWALMCPSDERYLKESLAKLLQEEGYDRATFEFVFTPPRHEIVDDTGQSSLLVRVVLEPHQ